MTLMALAAVSVTSVSAAAQDSLPSIRAATLDDRHVIDGRLDETGWAAAGLIQAFTQTDPREGAPALARTTVRVLAEPKGLVVGIDVEQPAGVRVVSFNVWPAVTAGAGVPAVWAPVDEEFQPSLDVTKRIGANVLASVTANTDFAETEVDTRRTNLTRFPLFFPEKRTFFLEGDDIFAFGLGLNQDVLPYFSRRIGLVRGTEIPILAGGKVNGRASHTNFGGLVAGTNDKDGIVANETVMAVGRVKQNILRESWVGAIATVGDPLGRPGSWLAGVWAMAHRATFSTTR